MKVGNLVRYEDQAWRVYRADAQVRTVTLLHWSGQTLEVEDDNPGLKVIADVSVWPFVAAPRKAEKAGRLTRLIRTTEGRTVDLEPNVDWVPSDPFRSGGSIFLNPKLRLRIGEILVAHHTSDSNKITMSRVPITRGFGSVSQRQKRSGMDRPREPRTWMDHLIDDD